MASITPFKIAVPDSKLDLLKKKLALTDFPDESVEVDDPWTRGVPISEVKRIADYWQSGFDWRRVEAKLNEYAQFTASIQADGFGVYDVHFVHQTSTVSGAIPLLFLHGWPGSFLEVTKVLPDLVSGGTAGPAFHVVAPSLIDFGFSSPSKKGFTLDQHAEIYHKLMQALGYSEYVIQGGDLGHLIARIMAQTYGPNHVKAHHINCAAPAQPTEEAHPDLHAKCNSTPLTQSELAGLAASQRFSQDGDGYYKLQSTRPLTLGYSLTDSPVGLLAWMYEKIHDWTDPSLYAEAWTDDDVLTWVSIHWFSRAGPGASCNPFYENEHRTPEGAFAAAQRYADVPLGVARFARDLVLLPRLWVHTMGPVVFESEHEKGGHFASWERPDALVSDLRAMFGKGGGAYGCVPGRDGYLS